MAYKMHEWLIRNDEKRTYCVARAKSAVTMRKRVNERKETLMGRVDKLSPAYKAVADKVRGGA